MRSLVPADLEIVEINLDETSVKMHHGNRRGNIVFPRGLMSYAIPRQQGSPKMLRGCLTHVAMICNHASVQAELPQVLLCSANLVTLADTMAIRAVLPHNVYFLRRPSGWSNTQSMLEVFQLLNLCLSRFHGYKFILSMDTAKSHLDKSLRDYLHAIGFFVYYIPAGMTWLLQPADTHLFLSLIHI